MLNLIPPSALAAVLILVGYKLCKFELWKKMYQAGYSQSILYNTSLLIESKSIEFLWIGCPGHQSLGLINKWLRHIKDIYPFHQAEHSAISDSEKRWDRLVELNVQEQIHPIAEITFVQSAWNKNKKLLIHGWVFDLKTGIINDLYRIDSASALDSLYKFQFDPI